jgi:hypothetical protein
MTELLVGVCVTLSLAVAVLLYELHGMPRLRRRCIVNLRDAGSDSIEGVLWTRRGRWLVLKDARLIHAADGSVMPADGEVLIDRAQVNFLQVF